MSFDAQKLAYEIWERIVPGLRFFGKTRNIKREARWPDAHRRVPAQTPLLRRGALL